MNLKYERFRRSLMINILLVFQSQNRAAGVSLTPVPIPSTITTTEHQIVQMVEPITEVTAREAIAKATITAIIITATIATVIMAVRGMAAMAIGWSAMMRK